MANRSKGEVTLRIAGVGEFVLVMDFQMRCEVEDLCNKPFMAVADEAHRGFHRAIRAIFWGALRRHHSDMSMGDVTALIENHEAEIAAALSAASAAAAPPAEGKDRPRPPAKRRGGKTSGGNGAKRA